MKGMLKLGCGAAIALGVILVIAAALSSGNKTEPQATLVASVPPVPAAPSTKPTNVPIQPTAAPAPAKLGDTVAAGNWSYQVSKVERVKTLIWSDFGNKTDAKGEWLVAYVSLKNQGKETYSINTWDFEVHDSSGIKFKHDTGFTVNGYATHKKLSSPMEQFPPGVSAESVLLFDIAPDAKGLRLWLVQAKQYIALQ